MKTMNLLLLLLATIGTSPAQNNFFASLDLDQVTLPPDGAGVHAKAEFSTDASSVRFTIRFGVEDVIPTAARLLGSSELTFELGSPSIVIHSPGPWPDGYDGSTTFSGAFSIPDTLRADLSRGTVTVFLTGSVLGDFHGFILPSPVARPTLEAVERTDSSLRFRFAAEPSYQYTLEAAASLDNPGWSSITNFVAEGEAAEAVLTDTVADVAARFYRIRKQQTASGVLGQVFIYGCPVQGPGIICERPYPTGITIRTREGDVASKLTTDSDGRFEQLLKPGRYVLVPDGAGEPRLPYVGVVPIRVWPKQLTTVIVVYDSGIR